MKGYKESLRQKKPKHTPLQLLARTDAAKDIHFAEEAKSIQRVKPMKRLVCIRAFVLSLAFLMQSNLSCKPKGSGSGTQNAELVGNARTFGQRKHVQIKVLATDFNAMVAGIGTPLTADNFWDKIINTNPAHDESKQHYFQVTNDTDPQYVWVTGFVKGNRSRAGHNVLILANQQPLAITSEMEAKALEEARAQVAAEVGISAVGEMEAAHEENAKNRARAKIEAASALTKPFQELHIEKFHEMGAAGAAAASTSPPKNTLASHFFYMPLVGMGGEPEPGGQGDGDGEGTPTMPSFSSGQSQELENTAAFLVELYARNPEILLDPNLFDFADLKQRLLSDIVAQGSYVLNNANNSEFYQQFGMVRGNRFQELFGNDPTRFIRDYYHNIDFLAGVLNCDANAVDPQFDRSDTEEVCRTQIAPEIHNYLDDLSLTYRDIEFTATQRQFWSNMAWTIGGLAVGMATPAIPEEAFFMAYLSSQYRVLRVFAFGRFITFRAAVAGSAHFAALMTKYNGALTDLSNLSFQFIDGVNFQMSQVAEVANGTYARLGELKTAFGSFADGVGYSVRKIFNLCDISQVTAQVAAAAGMEPEEYLAQLEAEFAAAEASIVGQPLDSSIPPLDFADVIGSPTVNTADASARKACAIGSHYLDLNALTAKFTKFFRNAFRSGMEHTLTGEVNMSTAQLKGGMHHAEGLMRLLKLYNKKYAKFFKPTFPSGPIYKKVSHPFIAKLKNEMVEGTPNEKSIMGMMWDVDDIFTKVHNETNTSVVIAEVPTLQFYHPNDSNKVYQFFYENVPFTIQYHEGNPAKGILSVFPTLTQNLSINYHYHVWDIAAGTSQRFDEVWIVPLLEVFE